LALLSFFFPESKSVVDRITSVVKEEGRQKQLWAALSQLGFQVPVGPVDSDHPSPLEDILSLTGRWWNKLEDMLKWPSALFDKLYEEFHRGTLASVRLQLSASCLLTSDCLLPFSYHTFVSLLLFSEKSRDSASVFLSFMYPFGRLLILCLVSFLLC
jgi:hypothetical protein